MIIRVVVTGPECTGKTTLAGALGAVFDAEVIPEASRAYAEERAREGTVLTVNDVAPIAGRQMAAEDAAVARTADRPGESGAQLLVLDTDLLSTVAYARHYYGWSSAALEGDARARLGDLYLLCAPDISWQPDGVRDRPENRDAMFAHFEGVLAEFGANVRVVRGLGHARTDAAISAVRECLASRRATGAGEGA